MILNKNGKRWKQIIVETRIILFAMLILSRKLMLATSYSKKKNFFLNKNKIAGSASEKFNTISV